FFGPMFWSITLAIFVFPFQRRLNCKIRSKNFAALIGTILTAGVVLIPIVIILIQVGHEIHAFYIRLSDWGGMDRIFEWLNGATFSNWVEKNIGISIV